LLVGNEGSQESGILDIEKEFAAIEGVAGLSSSRMFGKDALPDRVLSAMAKRSWVHISCHGLLDQMQPTESYFQLDCEEKLMVSEIIKFRFPNAELAFLSACHTASGGIVLIDEALHLASAFQFSGFESIIGTMWEMWDDEAPELARDFYSYLMDHGGSYRNSARALAYAIKQMRKRGSHPGRWAMLIHAGV
jgi:CHAT domain-containing protein